MPVEYDPQSAAPHRQDAAAALAAAPRCARPPARPSHGRSAPAAPPASGPCSRSSRSPHRPPATPPTRSTASASPPPRRARRHRNELSSATWKATCWLSANRRDEQPPRERADPKQGDRREQHRPGAAHRQPENSIASSRMTIAAATLPGPSSSCPPGGAHGIKRDGTHLLRRTLANRRSRESAGRYSSPSGACVGAGTDPRVSYLEDFGAASRKRRLNRHLPNLSSTRARMSIPTHRLSSSPSVARDPG